jgi:hypothetical protein
VRDGAIMKLQLQFVDDVARESFCKRAAILLRMFTGDGDTEVTMAARSLVKVFSSAGSSIFAFADASRVLACLSHSIFA